MGSQRRSSSSPKPQADPQSSSNTSRSRRLRPTPAGAPRTLGRAPHQAMARAGGSGGCGGGGSSSRHPQFVRGSPAPRAAPSSWAGSVIRRQGRRGCSGRLSSSCVQLCGILDSPGRGREAHCEGHGCRRCAPNPALAASAHWSPRSPPAHSAATLSQPKPSPALEVRWAVAGRDGQRATPMAGRCGQWGAWPLCGWRGQAPPARHPPPPLSPSLPAQSAPPCLPALTFLPPGSRHCGARRGWSQTLRPGQPAPSSPR